MYPLQWLSKRQEIINTGDDVEERELWCTFQKNIQWGVHYRKQHGGSPKN